MASRPGDLLLWQQEKSVEVEEDKETPQHDSLRVGAAAAIIPEEKRVSSSWSYGDSGDDDCGDDDGRDTRYCGRGGGGGGTRSSISASSSAAPAPASSSLLPGWWGSSCWQWVGCSDRDDDDDDGTATLSPVPVQCSAVTRHQPFHQYRGHRHQGATTELDRYRGIFCFYNFHDCCGDEDGSDSRRWHRHPLPCSGTMFLGDTTPTLPPWSRSATPWCRDGTRSVPRYFVFTISTWRKIRLLLWWRHYDFFVVYHAYHAGTTIGKGRTTSVQLLERNSRVKPSASLRVNDPVKRHSVDVVVSFCPIRLIGYTDDDGMTTGRKWIRQYGCRWVDFFTTSSW